MEMEQLLIFKTKLNERVFLPGDCNVDLLKSEHHTHMENKQFRK